MITVIVIGIVAVFALLVLRMPAAIAFGLVGFLGICYLEGFHRGFVALYTVPYSQMSNYIWATLPLYILFGDMAAGTRFTDDFFSGARTWLGHLRGGLLHAVIVGNAAFGACCGVSIAAATSFTAISLPETRKYNYNDATVLGSICGSSTLSMLIPPSAGLIMFGCLTQTSISELFIGGIVPGLIQMVLFMVAAWYIAVRRPKDIPLAPKATSAERRAGTVKMLYLVIIFVVIIGGLYLGIFTPTEGAGIGVVVVLILGAFKRRLSWEGIRGALMTTIRLAVSIFLLLAGTMIFNSFLALTGVGTMLSAWIGRVTTTPEGFLILVSIVMIILGMFIDVAPLTMLLVPLLFPISQNFGVDPIQFGVLFTLLCSFGTITPPFGIVTFTVARMVPDVNANAIFKATFPYLVMMAVLVIMLIFLPQASVALVESMRTY
ncbi:MAG: TRAP transporter large permease [Clostridiales Family XIII bacterium]|jgi:tripartite ATP-independent transporter DctM subunit|nr:TRAP transporter large permease [Clostridiales Family XIII bacterium]